MQQRVMKSANISPCGNYRYALRRAWDNMRGTMMFVMLNPSTDDVDDDPTIRRCVRLAQREGMGAICVVNLFAYRTSNPHNLKIVERRAASNTPRGIVGPENDMHIVYHAGQAEKIVCAWGSRSITHETGRAAAVVTMLSDHYILYHLGLNKDGSPKHPLYLRCDTPLQEWKRP